MDSIGNGTTCNRDAIGTKVIIDSQTGRQSREVRESNGFSAQGDRRLLFGLGHQTQEVQVQIYWCGNATPEVKYLTPDRY
ncbi:MAG: ASPIC/UnbV domain-containing protein [Hormoscilla sp. SP5CHS1]|nr:ASPIC/UnbV domain-containing protein [Hormoscilla sp. SP12CHS1]MBC6455296.1 ASPIC/UnbV domain-containing protein [Hormoscilla sp. SP5CHS1]